MNWVEFLGMGSSYRLLWTWLCTSHASHFWKCALLSEGGSVPWTDLGTAVLHIFINFSPV